MNLNILDLGTIGKLIFEILKKLSKKINSKNMGVLVCGSGIGMCIASFVLDFPSPSKVINSLMRAFFTLPSLRLTPNKIAIQSVFTFLTTKFEGGRHSKRVKLLN